MNHIPYKRLCALAREHGIPRSTLESACVDGRMDSRRLACGLLVSTDAAVKRFAKTHKRHKEKRQFRGQKKW